jgi:hypothetical protein
LEGLPFATHVSVDPEPPTGREPPALLVDFFFKGTKAGLSCPLSLEGNFDRVAIGCKLFGDDGGVAFLLPIFGEGRSGARDTVTGVIRGAGRSNLDISD